MNAMTMQTNYDSSAKAARIIPFSLHPDHTPVVEAFIDNLDHLLALEHEAKLMLALASMRRCMQDNTKDGDLWKEYRQHFPILPAEATLEQVRSLLACTAANNRQREELSQRHGIQLNYCEFCSEWRLEEFEKKALLLLLMRFTAPGFADIFANCKFENSRNTSIEVGTLLGIICNNLREQLEYRRYFSINAALIREEIFVMHGTVDSTDNILDMDMYLHERIARYIVGDNNLYNSAFKFIRRDKCAVSLDQVILPDTMKDEITGTISRYLKSRENGTIEELDDFYGYGTGMTFLFHGPSGTGKTMLARALATHCRRELITFCTTDMRNIHMGDEEILAALFREAALHNAIVLLDECDDMFENNSHASRALLLEIEKARCVIILATNKPVDLDPAMERRLTMKVPFTIPDAELRLKMWQALLPKTATFADDVDLFAIAERFLFTGGLIKNSIFMALNSVIGSLPQRQATISRDALEHAAGLQSLPLGDISYICKVYTPRLKIENMNLRNRQKDQLGNMAQAYHRLQEEGLGLNLLLSSSDIKTGIMAVEGLAERCGLKIKEYDYAKVIAQAEDKKIIDPVTQKKVTPMQYAFSAGTGDASMILFVDHEGVMGKMLENKSDLSKDILLLDLLGYLREHRKFFCMVTGSLPHTKLPLEFNLRFELEHPAEEFQISRWEEVLGKGAASDNELVSLVEHYPMHAAEIDFIARQATIQTIIKGKTAKPQIACIQEVISSYRQKTQMPVLFGGGW